MHPNPSLRLLLIWMVSFFNCRMSAIQKLVLEQDAKRHVPIVPTHFYHVNPKEGIVILNHKCYVFTYFCPYRAVLYDKKRFYSS